MNPSDSPVASAPGYRQDTSVYTTMLSVYAVAGALDLVLKDLCGEAYSGLCSEFTQSDDVMGMMTQKLRDVTFTWDDAEFSLADGQLVSGYTVYRLKNGNTLPVSLEHNHTPFTPHIHTHTHTHTAQFLLSVFGGKHLCCVLVNLFNLNTNIHAWWRVRTNRPFSSVFAGG